MPEFPELPHVHHLAGEAEEKEEGERFPRIVVVAIVLATLGAALTAFAQAAALRDHDEATAEAVSLASRALDARGLSDQAANLQVERFQLAREQRSQAADARQQAFTAPASERPALAAESARWTFVAAATERNTRRIAAAYGLPPVALDGRDGPARDPDFPQRYVAGTHERAYELSAEREIANEQAEHHEAQVGRYAISLTLFAVAVFLFGYSLTPHAQRRRGVFAGVAAAFAIVGGIWTLVTVLRPTARPPARAAVESAAGRASYDAQEYDRAVGQLSAALRLWPESAQTHITRALAELGAGSPQVDVPISLSTPQASAAALADEKAALDLGAEDSGLLVQYGFNLVSVGLHRGDDAMIEQGLSVSERAADERPGDPVPLYNAAAAQLALGRVAEARETYRRAVEANVFADARRHLRRNDTTAYELYLGEALTDIESVRVARPRLARAIAAIKDELVGIVTRAANAEPLGPRGRQDARADGIALDVGPSYVHFRIARPANIAPDSDFSTQWYYAAPGGLGSSVLSDVSGATTNDVVQESSGALVQAEPYLTLVKTCLLPGPYRLEVYVNGRLAGEQTTVARFPRLVATRSPDLGVSSCLPPNWRPIARRQAGLVDGYSSPDGRSGLVVVSLNRELIGAGRPSPALSRRLLGDVLHRFAPLLPAGIGRGTAAAQPFRVAPGGALVRRYAYPGGTMLAGAGATGSGELLVALVYGPSGTFGASVAPVFASLAPSD